MKTPVDDRQFLLSLTRPERAGIVHAVSRFVLGHGADIIDNRQFPAGVVHAGGASQPTPRDDPDRHPVA